MDTHTILSSEGAVPDSSIGAPSCHVVLGCVLLGHLGQWEGDESHDPALGEKAVSSWAGFLLPPGWLGAVMVDGELGFQCNLQLTPSTNCMCTAVTTTS